MATLRREFEIVPLLDLVERHSRGEQMARAVAVTFDDGYLDNLTVASPILRDFSVPATFFLTSDRLEEPGYVYWWDMLAVTFLGAGTFPETLTLEDDGRTLEWSLVTEEDRASSHSDLCWLLTHTPGSRREHVLRQIAAKFDGRLPGDAPRRMNRDEVVELSRRDGHDIGAHSVRHVRLPVEGVEIQREEIELSKSSLEKLIGRAVKTFAYPFGAAEAATAEAVQRAGYSAAVVCGDLPYSNQSTFAVPRLDSGARGIAPFDGWLSALLEPDNLRRD